MTEKQNDLPPRVYIRTDMEPDDYGSVKALRAFLSPRFQTTEYFSIEEHNKLLTEQAEEIKKLRDEVALAKQYIKERDDLEDIEICLYRGKWERAESALQEIAAGDPPTNGDRETWYQKIAKRALAGRYRNFEHEATRAALDKAVAALEWIKRGANTGGWDLDCEAYEEKAADILSEIRAILSAKDGREGEK